MKKQATASPTGSMLSTYTKLTRTARWSLAVLGGLLCLAWIAFTSAPAFADAPVFSSSFDCSATPAGSCAGDRGIARLAVDETSGDIYVVDRPHSVVDKFDSSGTYLCQITGAGLSTTSPSECDPLGASSPTGAFSFDDLSSAQASVTVDNTSGPNEGNVYVVSEVQQTVVAFNSSGTFLWEQDFSIATDDVCGVAVDRNGFVWASNDSTSTVVQLDGSGSPTGTSVDTSGHNAGPCDIAFDSKNDLYVAERNDEIAKYDPSGQFVGAIDAGSNRSVAVNLANDSVYGIQDPQIVEYDASGAAVSGTPFSNGTPTYWGGAVDNVRGKVYASDITDDQVQVFDIPRHNLAVTPDGTGTGSVTSSPGVGGISCGTTCSGPFEDDTTVTLTATASAGSQFAGWSGGGCSGAAPTCQVAMGTSDQAVTATFNTVPQHTVSVTKNGTGTGSVTSNPAGISCGLTCGSLFDEGSDVVLTATPAAHSAFAGWSGGGCSGTSTCEINPLNADAAITATFNKVQHTLTVTKAGSGTGTVTSDVAGIDCGATCNGLFDEPAGVTLTATPTGGSSFNGWSGGGCSGAGTCHVTMNAGVAVTATFNAPQPPPTTTTPTTTTIITKPPPGKASAPSSLKFKKGKASLKVTCKGGPCKGKFSLVVKIKQGTGKKAKTKTITIAKVTLNLAPGQSKTITVKLPSAVAKALKKSHKLKATATGPGMGSGKSVKLS